MIVLTVTAFWHRRRVRDVVFEPKRSRRRVVLCILSAAETDDVNAHPSFLMRMGVSSGTNASLVDLAALVGAVMLLVTPMVSLADGPGTLGARRACTRDAPA